MGLPYTKRGSKGEPGEPFYLRLSHIYCILALHPLSFALLHYQIHCTMRIHLKTLGCRLNEAELETWSHEFLQLGHSQTPELSDADLVVVNTCAVTQEAVKKSRKIVHKAQKSNPKAKLVVSGCYASLDPTATRMIEGVDLGIDNHNKDQLVEIIHRELDIHSMPVAAMHPGENPLLNQGRQRAFIKVQDGCRYQCTFCIVTVARGDERSRPIADVVNEINHLTEQGIQEAVLTGVHLGGYGSDLKHDLAGLISAILRNTDLKRLRLGAIEPWDLPADFWTLFDDPRLMPHLHLPLQSGSDSVLKRMARRCKCSEFERLAVAARDQIPDFNLTTDVIVGFPGETEAEWQQTLSFVEQIGFSHLHIFAYSARPGTRAAMLADPVPRNEIRQRSESLHQLGHRLKQDYLAGFIGRQFPILIEGDPQVAQTKLSGYTPNFLRVTAPPEGDANLTNTIQTLELTTLAEDGEHLIGQLVKE